MHRIQDSYKAHNCSAHDPLILKLTLKVDTATLITSQPPTVRRSMLWTKVDNELYNDALSAYLGTTCPTSDPEVAVQYLTKALKKQQKLQYLLQAIKVFKKPHTTQS